MNCNLCGSDNHRRLLDFGSQPIAHNYLADPASREPRYPFVFHFCDDCGHMFLAEPIDRDLLYEDYVTVSDWKFQPHIPRLVELIRLHTDASADSSILEVGSNDGRFLDALRTDGFRQLVGIEPARDALEIARKKGIETISGYFDVQAADSHVSAAGQCDLLVMRQVLEHITDLDEFGQAIQKVLLPGGFVAIEVPDFDCNLASLDYSLWEEHTNYFTIETLSRYLSALGIRVIHDETVIFSGRTLTVIGEYTGDEGGRQTSGLDELRVRCENYADKWPQFRSLFIEMLRSHKEAGGKSAIYGAGARLCSLVNFTDASQWLECIVDDQKEKQDLFLPGSQLPIISSDHLEQDQIDLCLLAVNTESEDPVIQKHPGFVQRGGKFCSVLPPSDRLPKFWQDLIAG